MKFLRWLYAWYFANLVRDVNPRDRCRCRAASATPVPQARLPGLAIPDFTIDNIPTMLDRFVIHSVDFLLSRRIIPCLRLIDAVERDDGDAFGWVATQCRNFFSCRQILSTSSLSRRDSFRDNLWLAYVA
jgi:hypothetical protein